MGQNAPGLSISYNLSLILGMSTHTHTHFAVATVCVAIAVAPARAPPPCLLVRLIRSHVGEQHFNFGFRFVLPTMSQRSRVSGFRAQHARPGNAPSSASSAAAAHSPQRGSNARLWPGLVRLDSLLSITNAHTTQVLN